MSREIDAEIQAGLLSIQALKFLRSTPEADLGCVEVALGIDADVVHPFELPGYASAAAPRGEHLAVLPPERDRRYSAARNAPDWRTVPIAMPWDYRAAACRHSGDGRRRPNAACTRRSCCRIR
jgi:hypothetical protein